MHNNDQVANVIALLRSPDSRRAVIQLFDAADIAKRRKEIPCTCVLQFMIRRRRLHMLTYMRSNDAFLGLSHDVFAFTMIQEIMARTLSVELGTYKHIVGSLHLYESDRESARRYLDEGWQTTTLPMPPMPTGDPWSSIRKVVRAERDIRLHGAIHVRELNLDNYWMDLVHLLEVYWHFKRHDGRMIARLKKTISTRVYDIYVEQKRQSAVKQAAKTTNKDEE
jgi:thymidylate synthase